MNREDIQKLLGGYATGTLTPEEQQTLFDAAIEVPGKPHQVVFLSILAGHTVLLAVDGYDDVRHVCSASSTERILSIATSRRCAISRFVDSSRRERAACSSSSEASFERSVPSA